ncbi:unnamed protein product [Bursaphelenchus okinawaensis]|uniref:Uncharacterized protein n=1 Tax=Bursaphelenchus okinawaensis TaxID=465554 RepID=A0A811KL78_9BILA|nr:unnamed protein product [Bursaphelenchus okinawaensis]CAG9105744.1 unnamed protein product [Bursaphelenchus okinawaensis]
MTLCSRLLGCLHWCRCYVPSLDGRDKRVLYFLTVVSVVLFLNGFRYNYWLNHQKLPARSCWCNGENFCFTGLDESLNHTIGSALHCENYEYIRDFGLLQSDIDKVSNEFGIIEKDWTPVFVTSASYNHFYELRQYVNVIRVNYKMSKIVVYDIGLSKWMVDEIKTWCLVEYRYFNFARYPEHSIVRDLNRGLILSFMTFTFSDHGIYGATDPGMLSYIPVPSNLTKSKEWQSTLLVTDSKYTRTLLKYFVLCALTEDCISPPSARLKCNFNVKNKITMEMGCHRYDQTFWNLYQLSYIFDPIQQGAIKLKLIKEWPEKMEQREIDEVLTQMGYRWVLYSKLFRTRRNDVFYRKMSNTCILG